MSVSASTDRFVFDSFMHSQGDTYVQCLIFKWAEVNCGIQYEESIERIKKLSSRLMQYANSSSHNSPKNMTVEGTITEIIEPPAAVEVAGLASFLLYTDLRSTLHARRPQRTVYQGRVTPSHVVLFGMLGITTGHSLYDQMYTDVYQNSTLADIKSSEEDSNLLDTLVATHLQHNPADATLL